MRLVLLAWIVLDLLALGHVGAAYTVANPATATEATDLAMSAATFALIASLFPALALHVSGRG